jgi:hypothetical protein
VSTGTHTPAFSLFTRFRHVISEIIKFWPLRDTAQLLHVRAPCQCPCATRASYCFGGYIWVWEPILGRTTVISRRPPHPPQTVSKSQTGDSARVCETAGRNFTVRLVSHMATTHVQTANSAQSPHQHFEHLSPAIQRKHSKQKFVTDLSQCLFDFVIQLLPTAEEMAVKEDVRKLLERLIRTIEPDSRLLSFGSTANGFSLRNSGE